MEGGVCKDEGRGSGPFTAYPYTHTHTHTHTHTLCREQFHFYLVYILEFCMRFCLKRLYHCYGSVKSTAMEASCLRTRAHFYLQRKGQFSDSFAYRTFFGLIFFFFFKMGKRFHATDVGSKNTGRSIYFFSYKPETRNFLPKWILARSQN